MCSVTLLWVRKQSLATQRLYWARKVIGCGTNAADRCCILSHPFMCMLKVSCTFLGFFFLLSLKHGTL